MPLSLASKYVKFARSSDKIGSPTSKFSASRTFDANAASGKITSSGTVTPIIRVPPCFRRSSTSGFHTALPVRLSVLRFVMPANGEMSLT